eukprot:scaffold21386_cov45-Isochrysis_galbana.AAC.1
MGPRTTGWRPSAATHWWRASSCWPGGTRRTWRGCARADRRSGVWGACIWCALPPRALSDP